MEALLLQRAVLLAWLYLKAAGVAPAPLPGAASTAARAGGQRTAMADGRLAHVRAQLGSAGDNGGGAGGGGAPGSSVGTAVVGALAADGRFNETPDRSKPERAADLSRLLFASFGLDRFPRYLSRWSIEDVDALEVKLEAQLELVRCAIALLLLPLHCAAGRTLTVGRHSPGGSGRPSSRPLPSSPSTTAGSLSRCCQSVTVAC